MEIQTARRRLETIAAHVSAAGNTSATHLFPLNCSGGLASVKRRCDNSMHFAKQDSESQGCFMRPNSTKQDCFDQSMLTFRSTCNQKEESSELVTTPLFSPPASMNIDVPKVRNIQHDVSDYMLPYSQPPKFSRTTIERDEPIKFNPKNNQNATKHLGFEKKLSPRMDIAESGGKYVLLIELPGISIDDIRVQVDNTTLTVQTIKGRYRDSSLSDHANSSYHKKEILEGPFDVKWPLPFDVNPDSVSAEFLDGLLHITITKLRVPVW
ncbi:small heat shock protein C4 [Helianthus annuus]|uniref:small heat shock protein C4 n=1 Tax=Helianthus annuus TaxID=4232 RepID=UPI000B90848D|nr:small heat shock protein C4 [Helianthus annuus]